MIEFLPKEELFFNSREDAMVVADLLVKNSYAVLITEEEHLTVLSCIECYESGYADRNEVVCMHRAEFEDKFFEIENE